MSKTRIYLSDTTLRDGEQSPGFSMFPAEKLELALQLERLRVDRIEAGFPSASEAEFQAVRAIGQAVKSSEVMAFARIGATDIECAARALEGAAKPVLHTFIPTSDLHLSAKVGWTRQEALDRAGEGLRRARQLFDTIQFAMEDASRSDPEFCAEVARLGVEHKAQTINIADTVGYILPAEWAAIVSRILAVPGMDDVVLSVHCHDDLGLAVANSLAAVLAGARQIECTINGIGERAGNAALEELVMAFRTRDMGRYTEIDTTELFRTSRLLSMITGINPQPNKAIVGRNAFAHEAGIHQAGMVKNPLTYEIMSPESVGISSRTFVLGKHSGRAGLASRLADIGITLPPAELDDVYQRFCALADVKKVIYEADLRSLIKRQTGTSADYELVDVQYSGTATGATATLTLRKAGALLSDSATGTGPFEACAKALCRIIGYEFRTEDVECTSNSRGQDCLANVFVQISDHEGRLYTGKAGAIDLVRACAEAYLCAANAALLERANLERGRKAPADPDPRRGLAGS